MSNLNGNRARESAADSIALRFDSIDDAVRDIRDGKMVIVIDDEDRENEGDIIMAATAVTPADVNFITRNARGLLCAPMVSSWLKRLGLAQMVSNNTARLGTRFTVSVDLLAGATTGISTADRAQTLNALARRDSQPEEFGRPGHIFPLEANEGGTLARPGHTEAAIDLCRLAGVAPVGTLCEILSDDGSMARTPELMEKAKEWGLRIITIEALVGYLQRAEVRNGSRVTHSGYMNGSRDGSSNGSAPVKQIEDPAQVEEIVVVDFPTKWGEFRLHVFRSLADGKDHVAITKGEFQSDSDSCEKVFTRIHSECLTGDTLGSQRCDCGSQLALALERIETEGRGIVLYMRQEGRGIGLANKIKAYALQEKGADTVEANVELGFEPDLREYATCAAMLRTLGVSSVVLMTNNPSKIKGLEAGGVRVTRRDSAFTAPNRFNKAYMQTKREKLGHLLGELDSVELDRVELDVANNN
jgi:3,4-dihydroxy 2-butanone 4-phosphate synthase / GTP cyclohydrolase II